MRVPTYILILTLCLAPWVAAKAADTPDDLRRSLVRTAAIIRETETRLQTIDTRLDALTEQRDRLEKDYTDRRARMARALSALTRMGRTPREAVLIRPGGPLQAARTSMLLSASLPAIETEVESVRILLTELEKTRQQLADQSAKARTARDELKSSHTKLSVLLDARGQANAGRMIVWQSEARKVADLARAASDLNALLGTLDGGAAPAVTQMDDGEGILPVSGVIRVGYGQTDGIGAKSSGLTIETLPGSVVVAPLDGVVRYTGPFKGYGNIVIIAHAGGYYSLLAGLDKISVIEGQTIVSGEPIAILEGNADANPASSSARSALYYELRRQGQPVNPSRKLPGLG